MVSVCLEIETTRDIARQILRHRSFSFQEFSQRYAPVNLDFECREARLQDSKNRQNSLETDDQELKTRWAHPDQPDPDQAHPDQADPGQARPGQADPGQAQARVVLPEGMTPSRMYVNGTLRSWIHYIELRSGNGTQKEHREVALECAKVIRHIFPCC
jgi:thymidylate synthase (FAD)